MSTPRAPGGVLLGEARPTGAGGFGPPATLTVGRGTDEGVGPPKGKGKRVWDQAPFFLHQTENPLGLRCARGAARPSISSMLDLGPLGYQGDVAGSVTSRSLLCFVRPWGSWGTEPPWPSWVHSATGLWCD